MNKRNGFAALVLVLAVVVAGCGSTGGSTGPSEPDAGRQQQRQEQQEAQVREDLAKIPDEELMDLVERGEFGQLLSRIELADLSGEQIGKILMEEYDRRVSAETERRANLPVTEDDFEIQQNRQGTITITKYTGQAMRVSIPAAISGVAVTEIGTYAFKDTPVISVVIPDTVTSVFGGVFENCRSLQSVQLPATLETIYGVTFSGCSSLRSVQLPSTLKHIYGSAFEGCALTSLTIPDGVTEIGDYAFSGATFETGRGIFYSGSQGSSVSTHSFHPGTNRFPDLVIPDSVVSIGYSAFRDCGIQTLKLGSGLTTIGASAFADNTIKDLTIPDSVTSIGMPSPPRYDYPNPESLEKEKDSDSRHYPGAFERCGIETLQLGRGVSEIGVRAFAKNQLTEFVLPASVITVREEAFSDNRISALVILNGITLLGRDRFANNPLASVTIPPSLAASGDGAGFYDAFRSMTALTSITLPANVARGNLTQFGEDFVNFWTSQGGKAGTYVKNGRIWTVQ
jgi:uncharacterized protein YceK